MTKGYEYFDFEYLDLDDWEVDYWMDTEEFTSNVDVEIDNLWDELENIYDIYTS